MSFRTRYAKRTEMRNLIWFVENKKNKSDSG